MSVTLPVTSDQWGFLMGLSGIVSAALFWLAFHSSR